MDGKECITSVAMGTRNLVVHGGFVLRVWFGGTAATPLQASASLCECFTAIWILKQNSNMDDRLFLDYCQLVIVSSDCHPRSVRHWENGSERGFSIDDNTTHEDM